MRKIPRVMSTQHPDNVTQPFFADESVLGGEDEIQEAYYAFSHLGCDEQMWDCEGKEVDSFVVRKLLTKYPHFFKENRLGKDVFLTLRVPNPTVEKDEAKVLLETLEGIPRAYDTAKIFYQEDTPPIFEVILPMTASWQCLNRIYLYYKDFVAGKQDKLFFEGDLTISEWIGKFKPAEINVIPLVEDKDHLLSAHQIVRDYLRDKKVNYQRVFLARSDPAMNYGLISSVLLNKVALQRLDAFSREIGIEIFPIIGVGACPFRGNFKPTNIENCLEEYPSVQTFTVQSAFKYDYPTDQVVGAIEKIRRSERGLAAPVDEVRCLEIIEKTSRAYAQQVEFLAPLINEVAKHVPSRRKRKLHIGLFGYSRSVQGISLPRAIGFCAALYSIGLPPEILGLNGLGPGDIDYLKGVYVHFEDDLREALSYFNPEVLGLIPPVVAEGLTTDIVEFETNHPHKTITSRIISSLKEESVGKIQEEIVEAGWVRRFLG